VSARTKNLLTRDSSACHRRVGQLPQQGPAHPARCPLPRPLPPPPRRPAARLASSKAQANQDEAPRESHPERLASKRWAAAAPAAQGRDQGLLITSRGTQAK